jgi:hypothetical protein
MLADLSDILLGAGAIGAALYCLVLSRRLRRLNDLEGGVGGAVAVLSAQVDDLTQTLQRAEAAARAQVATLAEGALRAEAAAQRLALLMASLHDLPDAAEEPEAPPATPVFVRHPARSPAGTGAPEGLDPAPRAPTGPAPGPALVPLRAKTAVPA